jgi:tetratricopeptide (TPR) repeat protein
MKRSASLIILVAGTLFASCSSLQTISFDQLQAADVSFPDAVRKVAVINNMPVLKTKDNHEILSSELEGDGKVASEALAENIANVNYFDQVIICDSVFRAQDKVPRVNVILTKEEVRKLSEDLGVDMILSFDRIHIQTKPGVLFYPDFPMPIDAVDGIISPIVRVYIPNRDKPLFVVAKQDTISWEIEPVLSDRKIVKEASEYAASIPVEHLLPHWDEVARFYYDGGNIEMRDAGVYLRENNWDEAYSQWKIAYEKRKGQQKMKAAFNIALYYEIKDNVEQAKEWLGKAKNLVKSGSRDEQLIAFYSLELEKRESKLSQLRIQMKRFDDNF